MSEMSTLIFVIISLHIKSFSHELLWFSLVIFCNNKDMSFIVSVSENNVLVSLNHKVSWMPN